jgi:hypothetical protein
LDFKLVCKVKLFKFLSVETSAFRRMIEDALKAGSKASASMRAAKGGTEFPICLRTSVMDPANAKSSG